MKNHISNIILQDAEEVFTTNDPENTFCGKKFGVDSLEQPKVSQMKTVNASQQITDHMTSEIFQVPMMKAAINTSHEVTVQDSILCTQADVLDVPSCVWDSTIWMDVEKITDDQDEPMEEIDINMLENGDIAKSSKVDHRTSEISSSESRYLLDEPLAEGLFKTANVSSTKDMEAEKKTVQSLATMAGHYSFPENCALNNISARCVASVPQDHKNTQENSNLLEKICFKPPKLNVAGCRLHHRAFSHKYGNIQSKKKISAGHNASTVPGLDYFAVLKKPYDKNLPPLNTYNLSTNLEETTYCQNEVSFNNHGYCLNVEKYEGRFKKRESSKLTEVERTKEKVKENF